MKKICFTLCFSVLVLNVLIAQINDRMPAALKSKLEGSIKRNGRYPQSIDYQDSTKGIFDAVPGHSYGVYFFYKADSKSKRLTIVYELDEKGNRVNALQPNLDKGIREGDLQIFFVRIDQPASESGKAVKYEVLTNSSSKVALYQVDKIM